jgi:hypothetical protein
MSWCPGAGAGADITCRREVAEKEEALDVLTETANRTLCVHDFLENVWSQVG